MSVKDDNTVSKTIRLPVELVEYVELQDGKNFSSKLINLLDDVRNGDANRRATIAEYDDLIRDRRQKLREISDNMYNATLVTQKLEQFWKSIQSIVSEGG